MLLSYIYKLSENNMPSYSTASVGDIDVLKTAKSRVPTHTSAPIFPFFQKILAVSTSFHFFCLIAGSY